MTRTIDLTVQSGRRIEQSEIRAAMLEILRDVHFNKYVLEWRAECGERPSDAVPGFLTLEVPGNAIDGRRPQSLAAELEVKFPNELSRVADIEQDRLDIKADVQPTDREIQAALCEL